MPHWRQAPSSIPRLDGVSAVCRRLRLPQNSNTRSNQLMPAPDPRVTVTLPDGRTVDARLLARRQDEDGHWWYRITADLPATTVRPVDGEDYSHVPTEKAADRWVLQALRHDTPDKRALVLHKAGCWAAEGRTEPATREQARIFLREEWATACDGCKPEP